MFHDFDMVKAIGAFTAFALAVFLILLAFGKLDRPLDRLITAFIQVTDALGHALASWLRSLRPALADALDVEPTPGLDGEPEEVDDPERAGLTLAEVVAKARQADAEDPAVALEERMRHLAADMAQRHGTKLTVGSVRSDYDPAIDYREEDPDEVDGGGSDADRPVEGDDDGYPRAGTVLPPVPDVPPFSRWDADEEQANALTYNAMHALPEADSTAWKWTEATGSWSVLNESAEVSA